MGKFIGTKTEKAEQVSKTFTPKPKDGVVQSPVTEKSYSTGFYNSGNRSFVVNVVRAYDKAGKEIDIFDKVFTLDIRVVTFENDKTQGAF